LRVPGWHVKQIESIVNGAHAAWNRLKALPLDDKRT
jgi:hypothetical protein